MLGCASRRVVWALAWVVLLGQALPLMAQDNAAPPSWAVSGDLPEGWEASGLDQFIADYQVLWNYQAPRDWATRSKEQRRAQTDKAWALITDEGMMEEGEWPSIVTLVSWFGHTAGEYQDDRGDQLQTLFKARLASEAAPVAGDYQHFSNFLRAVSLAGAWPADQVETKTAEATAAWVDQGDLSAVPLPNRLDMLKSLSGMAVNPNQYAARFTGTITVTEAGSYRFDRYAYRGMPFAGDHARIRIGGQVVLDTFPDADIPGADPSGGVDLPVGDHAFVAEFFRDVTSLQVQYGETQRQPNVTLLWKKPGEPGVPGASGFSLVPSETFAASRGLQATFYSNPSFEGDAVRTDIVPSLQYTRGGLCLVYPEAVAKLKASLVNGAHAAWPSGKELGDGWWLALRLESLGAQERAQMMGVMLDQSPGFFATISPRKLVPVLLMNELADEDLLVRLVQAWSADSDLLTTQPAVYGGSGRDNYHAVNDGLTASNNAWFLDQFAQTRWDVVTRVRDTCLANEDGSCDLKVLKLLLVLHRLSTSHSAGELAASVQQRIEGGQIEGDALATWHVAKALCSENAGLRPRLLADARSFELAYAAAESAEVKFWALNEHASRLASLGKSEQVESLLSAAGAGFNTPEQQAAKQACRSVAAAFHDARDRMAADERVIQLRSQVAAYERRVKHAQSRGDTQTEQRFADLLSNAESEQARELADYEQRWGGGQ